MTMLNMMEIAVTRNDGTKIKAYIKPEDTNPPNSGFGNASNYSVVTGTEEAGQFKFSADKTEWLYEGILSSEEQSQIAGFIQAFRAENK
jgi:hypothetical protein